MNAQQILEQLEALGTERTKKIYRSNGAKEPLFGVPTGKMKPLVKQIGIQQALAEALYATNNYDAMYFAGMIAEPLTMTKDDFDRWIEQAYFFMLSDYVVAVTLAESPIAQEVADAWIASGEELKMSAGWSCYCWLLGNQKDEVFSREKLLKMAQHVKANIAKAPPRTQMAMNQFLVALAISYKPLHNEAYAIAKDIGTVSINDAATKVRTLHSVTEIEKAIEKNRIGFKRKHVRC